MTTTARRLRLEGRVQAVGFRPFVHRLATELGLEGWVRNSSGRVVIEVQGEAKRLDDLERRLVDDAPPFAEPRLVASESIPAGVERGFRIAESTASGDPDVHIPPDMSVCEDCRTELHDSEDRRYRYPFINCTQCGPRATLILALPYDRARTTMAEFELCDSCRAEYDAPGDRRFHAEPVACVRCGPQLSWVPTRGPTVEGTDTVVTRAIAALRDGAILGVKGVGGYHLICDAKNADAVQRLRARKRRPTKPLALMVPAPPHDPLLFARVLIELDRETERALLSATRPIVLAPRRPEAELAAHVADGIGELGVMLAYSPLHDLLLEGLQGPVVATSGNLSGEPLAHDVETARDQLAEVADGFIHHNRGIVRPIDDAVVRKIAGAVRPFRLGRGLAPLELTLTEPVTEPVIALGGHQKNTIALAWGDRLVMSPHLGDLDSPAAIDNFGATVTGLAELFGVVPKRFVVDHHPDYSSSRYARRFALPIDRVWHHHAHASVVAAEAPEVKRWLVFTWDGVGLGEDGTLWGGEALVGSPGAWRRAASFEPLKILGAVRAGREPWRSAAALCWGAGFAYAPAIAAPELARAAWSRDTGTSRTSAVGRFFDAAAALVLNQTTYGHEAQGPMELEAAAARFAAAIDPHLTARAFPLERDENGVLRSDASALVSVLTDRTRSREERATVFHTSLVEAAVAQAAAIQETTPYDAIGLSGGVFQNRWLTERLVHRLDEIGLRVVIPRRVPVNDGGLAFGQVIETIGRR